MTVAILGQRTADAGQFGGKASGLGRLIELGHVVPPGFALPVTALADTIRHLGLDDLLERLDGSMATGTPDSATAEQVHAALLAGDLPGDLAAEVTEAVASLGGNELIVRSSASVEDSAMHSYAGMFESLRTTNLDEVHQAILSVWSSVFTSRALAYAATAGQVATPAMGVVIQRFIDADHSGVMFTTYRSPDGGERPLVEYVEGTAEKLVAGQVTPDRLWLDGEPTHNGLGVDTVAELARLATILESQMGGPQDVEWCLFDGAVHVVQSRPITAGFTEETSVRSDIPAILNGTGASPGVGSGPSHVAFNVEQALALRPGDVLVTTMTNPDMVVAMRNASAIVTDVGGMICHAAIVSRELQLPCVVGTGTATDTLAAGRVVTVDGTRGSVFDGEVELDDAVARVAGPVDAWELWRRGEGEMMPLVSTIEMLGELPPDCTTVALMVDGDLRCDEAGLWRSFGPGGEQLSDLLDRYVAEIDDTVRPEVTVHLVSEGEVSQVVLDRVADASSERIRVVSGLADPVASLASTSARSALPPIEESMERAMDMTKAPGPPPGMHRAPMPDARLRSQWWDLLPDYGRYHLEHQTPQDDGVFLWIEIRSEVLTSPLLKSLVLPGFEMVPHALGFPGAPPMHTKWKRARFHVRADAMGRTWAQLVAATWDPVWMEDFLRRVRQSYEAMADVVRLFPVDDTQAEALSTDEIFDLIAAWWPRWVEFFALCLFIQAQGERIVYPLLEQAVAANLADLPPPDGHRWPDASDLIAPTTPVLSGEFMASLEQVRSALDAAGVTSAPAAMEQLASGGAADLAASVERHLASWHWMRDRDLLFEPWDTPDQVIATALNTDPHPSPPYATNLATNRFATSLHADLAAASGRSDLVRHGVRFLQDLNVERENHHILWLKYSYPLRRVVVELERRLVADGVLDPGLVFYLQLPEVVAAVQRGEGLDGLRELAKQRRRAYRHEAKLEEVDPASLYEEDDYF